MHEGFQQLGLSVRGRRRRTGWFVEMSLSESGRVVTKTQNKQFHMTGIRQAKKSTTKMYLTL